MSSKCTHSSPFKRSAPSTPIETKITSYFSLNFPSNDRNESLPLISTSELPHEPQFKHTDNICWGSPPVVPTPSHLCRIIYQNINGIPITQDYNAFHDIGHNAQLMGAQILCLAETNVNWTARSVIHRSTSVLRKYWNHLKISHSSLQPAPTTNYY